MRRVSHNRVTKLLSEGVVLEVGGTQYVPGVEDMVQPSIDTDAEEFQETSDKKSNPTDYTETILKLIDFQNQTQKELVNYGKTIADVVENISKPRPKKKWKFVVLRDNSGTISELEAEEK